MVKMIMDGGSGTDPRSGSANNQVQLSPNWTIPREARPISHGSQAQRVLGDLQVSSIQL